MKNLFLILALIVVPHIALGQHTKELDLLRKAIQNRSKEGWAYSGASGGGYVFRVKLDVIGDSKKETLINYSIDDRNGFHIFSPDDQTSYLGSIPWFLLDKPKKKENGATKIWSTRSIGNYSTNEYKAFSKLVIINEITPEGVIENIRIAGVGLGRIEDQEYNQINYDPKSMKNAQFFDLNIEYKDLESFLLEKGSWQDFDKSDWRSINGGFYVRSNEVVALNPDKDSSSYTFSPEQALEALGNKARNDRKRGVRAKQNDNQSRKSRRSNREEESVNEKHENSSQWIYIIIVVLLTGCGLWYLKRKSS